MKKILIIEDEPHMRNNLAIILEMEGFAVFEAEDGREGILKFEGNSPDLVLCDVMMPDMDGYAVLQHIRKHPKSAGTPFVFLTARGEWLDVREGMNMGADDYLIKPVKVDDLLKAVRTRMERRDMQRDEIKRASDFKPDFSDPQRLRVLGLTVRECEVLCWVAQGKSNSEVATILGMTEPTVKKHLEHIFEKLGVENRNTATFRALEVFSQSIL